MGGHGETAKFKTTITVQTILNIMLVPSIPTATTFLRTETSDEDRFQLSFKKNKLGSVKAIVNDIVAPKIVQTIIMASSNSPIAKLDARINVVKQNRCTRLGSLLDALLLGFKST